MILSNRFEVFARRANWAREIELVFMQLTHLEDGGIVQSVALPLTMKDLPSNAWAQQMEPTVRIHQDAAQQLMDELWQCGLRPSEGTGSAGQLKAVQDHLADMRKLVFEK